MLQLPGRVQQALQSRRRTLCDYGEGPEYETVSALGAKCGNDNFESILHANTLCNQLGMDTISTGNTLAWAMECHQKGVLHETDLDGLDLHFGNAPAMVGLIKKIAAGRAWEMFSQKGHTGPRR